MAKTADEKKDPMELVAAVSGKVRIHNVAMRTGSFRGDFTSAGLPMCVSYEFNATGSFDRENQKLQIHVVLGVRGAYEEDAELANPPLLIQAEYVLDYTVDSKEDVGDEHIDAFSRINGVYNVWPYWREYVQSTTVRLGAPPLTLPLLTGDVLVKAYEEEKAKEKAGGDEEAG